jgi:hypothetical protein
LLDGAAEAKLIAMCLGKPPAGFGHWMLRLLADQMVELEIAKSISPETVRQTLKKWHDQAENRVLGDSSRRRRRVRRQHGGGAGDVRKSLHPNCPVVCMDEQPVQLIGETRMPIPATKEHPERVDYEYERKGTASIFMFAEPLSGFRQATARPRRTKDDWAHEVAHLLDTR